MKIPALAIQFSTTSHWVVLCQGNRRAELLSGTGKRIVRFEFQCGHQPEDGVTDHVLRSPRTDISFPKEAKEC